MLSLSRLDLHTFSPLGHLLEAPPARTLILQVLLHNTQDTQHRHLTPTQHALTPIHTSAAFDMCSSPAAHTVSNLSSILSISFLFYSSPNYTYDVSILIVIIVILLYFLQLFTQPFFNYFPFFNSLHCVVLV